MQRLYVLAPSEPLLLLLADEEACRQLDSGADPDDIRMSASTIDTSLIITINDDGAVVI